MNQDRVPIALGFGVALVCGTGTSASPDGDFNRARADIAAWRADAQPLDAPEVTSLEFGDYILPSMLQDEPVEGAEEAISNESRWDFELGAFLWAVSTDLDVTVKGSTVAVDMDFSDIWDALNFAGSVQFRGFKDRFMFQFNAQYVSLGEDANLKHEGTLTNQFFFGTGKSDKLIRWNIDIPVDVTKAISIDKVLKADVSANIELAWLELFAGYELYSFPLSGQSNPHTNREARIHIVPYGGGRLTWLDLETDYRVTGSSDVTVDAKGRIGPASKEASANKTITRSGFFEIDDDEVWVDPVIGLTIFGHNIGKWRFSLRGDVGGFGIGNASDLTWTLGGRITYQPKPRWLIWGGYFLIDYDYSDGSGADEFGVNGKFHGPVFGGSLTF